MKAKQVHDDPSLSDPSPSEIRLLCLEIQATWSEREREKRACVGSRGAARPVVVTAPIVKLQDIAMANST